MHDDDHYPGVYPAWTYIPAGDGPFDPGVAPRVFMGAPAGLVDVPLD